jgi:transcriptional regulator of acetoin/glycerol metabolism
VRAPIQASWTRALQLGLSPSLAEPTYVHRLDHATQLSRAAAPVLDHLTDELANEPVSVVLTDAHGLVVRRVCTDRELERWMDAAYLAPGFSYIEEEVGTNGIGTTLESGAATLVDGREHFTEDLALFSCAGAPIHHPITGVLVGVLDCTAFSRHSNALLLAFARSTAQRIEEQLMDNSGARELALFRDYLSACQRSSGAVLALNDDVVMLNHHAQQRFDASDQTSLLQRTSDAAGSREESTIVANLPSGLVARMEYRPAYSGTDLAGGVFRIQVQEGLERPETPAASAAPTLPGVVGLSPTWRRVGQDIDRSRGRGEWVVLEGESGVGKLALARAVHQLRTPAGHFCALDALEVDDPEEWLDSVSEELAESGGTLVLRHADLLSDELVTRLSELLTDTAGDALLTGPWVVLTLDSKHRNQRVDTELLPHFSRTVDVPPLRHHIEDLTQLVPALLQKLVAHERLELSPAAMRQLMRLPWTGNVDQLRKVLGDIARHRRHGVVDVDDLPPECRATSRRQLTRIESLERDAVVRALVRHDGDKGAAAEELGVSRATIYRKIRGYGIALEPRGRR